MIENLRALRDHCGEFGSEKKMHRFYGAHLIDGLMLPVQLKIAALSH